MTLHERLTSLAERGDGEITVGPQEGQDLEMFQATISTIRDYERRGLLLVVTQHSESHTGHRYVDRVRVRLTESGIEHWHKREQAAD